MKQFIFRHEKAISKLLAFVDTLLYVIDYLIDFFCIVHALYFLLTSKEYYMSQSDAISSTVFCCGMYLFCYTILLLIKVNHSPCCVPIKDLFKDNIRDSFVCEILLTCYLICMTSWPVFFGLFIFAILYWSFNLLYKSYKTMLEKSKAKEVRNLLKILDERSISLMLFPSLDSSDCQERSAY